MQADHQSSAEAELKRLFNKPCTIHFGEKIAFNLFKTTVIIGDNSYSAEVGYTHLFS